MGYIKRLVHVFIMEPMRRRGELRSRGRETKEFRERDKALGRGENDEEWSGTGKRQFQKIRCDISGNKYEK